MPPLPEILHLALLPTPHGDFLAHFSAQGLARLDFPTKRERSKAIPVDELPASCRAWAEQTQSVLLAALNPAAARHPRMTLPPLDLSCGTKFRLRVWAELRRIPRGQARSYGEIAEELGKPKAARAVGGACGANPVPVLIPCHRVLAANGGLGGFSGGLEWKRRLLAIEGVLLT
ncbi:MAG: methylated-DNA--[protein]-cysteine S-methyltransferase [Limisphaerales bacterium]